VASTWLYLARHGEVEHGGEGRLFGHADVPLSPVGRQQAEALARRLSEEPIEAVYASDLVRAQATAAPLAAARGLVPVLLPALREIALGDFEGLTLAEMEAREPGTMRRWLANPSAVAYPGGESLRELRARVLAAWKALVARHAGGCFAVVAHGGPNRVILAEALSVALGEILTIAQAFGAWSLIEYRREASVVHALNREVAVAGPPPIEQSTRRRGDGQLDVGSHGR
jgi:alpha-ribazole phosphatase